MWKDADVKGRGKSESRDRLAVGSIGFLQGRGTRRREENVGINGEIPMNGYDRQLASRSAGSRYQ